MSRLAHFWALHIEKDNLSANAMGRVKLQRDDCNIGSAQQLDGRFLELFAQDFWSGFYAFAFA